MPPRRPTPSHPEFGRLRTSLRQGAGSIRQREGVWENFAKDSAQIPASALSALGIFFPGRSRNRWGSDGFRVQRLRFSSYESAALEGLPMKQSPIRKLRRDRARLVQELALARGMKDPAKASEIEKSMSDLDKEIAALEVENARKRGS
jgi:hypothetical protein